MEVKFICQKIQGMPLAPVLYKFGRICRCSDLSENITTSKSDWKPEQYILIFSAIHFHSFFEWAISDDREKDQPKLWHQLMSRSLNVSWHIRNVSWISVVNTIPFYTLPPGKEFSSDQTKTVVCRLQYFL